MVKVGVVGCCGKRSGYGYYSDCVVMVVVVEMVLVLSSNVRCSN